MSAQKVPSFSNIIAQTSPFASQRRDKTALPPVPKVSRTFEVYFGGNFPQALALLQILHSTDQDILVRAVATLVCSVLRKKINFTGSDSKVIELDTHKGLKADSVTDDSESDHGFTQGVKVKVSDWVRTSGIELSEIAAYAGILMRAIANLPDPTASLDSFNKNRAGAATRAVAASPQIFVPGSIWINYVVLKKVNAAFSYYSAARANLFSNIVNEIPNARDEQAAIFISLFELLENTGLTGFTVVRIAMEKTPKILLKFPELYSQIEIVDDAFRRMATEDAKYRAYGKAMFQDEWVPANPRDIEQLVGVCTIVARVFVTSMKDYNGGNATPAQISKVQRLLTQQGYDITSDTNIDEEEDHVPAPPAPSA